MYFTLRNTSLIIFERCRWLPALGSRPRKASDVGPGYMVSSPAALLMQLGRSSGIWGNYGRKCPLITWQAPVAESQHKTWVFGERLCQGLALWKIAFGMLASPGGSRATSWDISDSCSQINYRELVSLRSTKSYIWVGPTVIHHKMEKTHLKTGVNKARGQKLAA